MRYAALLLAVLLPACYAADEHGYDAMFGDLVNDGLGGGPVMVVTGSGSGPPSCPLPDGDRFCTDNETAMSGCTTGCVTKGPVGNTEFFYCC